MMQALTLQSGADKLISTIWPWSPVPTPPDCMDQVEERIDITVKLVASYNWVPGPVHGVHGKTMVIPGAPPRLAGFEWVARRQPLERDKPEVMIPRENQLRSETYPMEPVIRSILHCNSPDFDFSAYDVVLGDRGPLRYIFEAEVSRKEDQFEIRAQVVGNLVLLYTEIPDVNQFLGFGHSFESACTKSQSPNTSGSHRQIVACKLGDLSMLVTCELDAVIAPHSNNNNNNSSNKNNKNGKKEQQHNSSHPFSEDSTLDVVDEGELIDFGSHQMVEFKTKSAWRALDKMWCASVWGQMYMSGVSVLVLGDHNKGVFEKPRILSIEEVAKKAGGACEMEQTMKRAGEKLDALVRVCRRRSAHEGQNAWRIACKVTDKGFSSYSLHSEAPPCQALPPSLLRTVLMSVSGCDRAH